MTIRRRALRDATLALACTALVLALGIAGAAPAQAATIQRIGRQPALARSARLLGPLNGAQEISVTVALRPRNPAALAALVAAVSDPRSPSYREFLDPRQFAARFAPTPAQINVVRAALRARGLDPGVTSPNGLSIPLRARVSTLEHAFSLSLVRVRLADGAREVLNTRAPALSSRAAGLVAAVIGLSSTQGLHPLRAPFVHATAPAGRPAALTRREPRPLGARPAAAQAADAGPAPCTAASSTAAAEGAYTANRIAAAYGFNGLYAAGDEGQGQTIALYELEPFSTQDIAAFASCYGLHPSLYEVSVDGGAGTGPGSGEAALDIEQTIVMAPRARVIVYEGPNSNANGPGSGPYDVLNAIVSQDLAQVVSTSWGQCEALEGLADARAEKTLLEEAAVQGQSFLAAAGDSGSEDCYGQTATPDTALAVDDPGSDPYATSVGGSTLAAIGPPPTEAVWNNGGSLSALAGSGQGAGGGGLSSFWAMPAYQHEAPARLQVVNAHSSGAPCGAGAQLCREVPDVSADADPNTGYEIYYNGAGTAGAGVASGWQATGGTSAATPLWAALVALANADPACGGVPIGFLNPALYRAAASAYASDFHDITSGENDFTGTNGGLYPAGPGYNMAAGLGTPDAAALAASLCGSALRPGRLGEQTSTVGGRVRLALRIADAVGSRLSFRARGLPVGLTIGARGVISGRPRRRGTYRAVVVVADQDGDARLISLPWRILPAPRIVHASLLGMLDGRPSLSLTVRVSAGAPALRQLWVRLPAGMRFSRPLRAAVHGYRGAPLRHRARLVRGALLVVLGSPARVVTLRIPTASLSSTSALRARISARHARRLTVRLQAIAANGESTPLRARL